LASPRSAARLVALLFFQLGNASLAAGAWRWPLASPAKRSFRVGKQQTKLGEAVYARPRDGSPLRAETGARGSDVAADRF